MPQSIVVELDTDLEIFNVTLFRLEEFSHDESIKNHGGAERIKTSIKRTFY
jgi:hypothetical protein